MSFDDEIMKRVREGNDTGNQALAESMGLIKPTASAREEEYKEKFMRQWSHWVSRGLCGSCGGEMAPRFWFWKKCKSCSKVVRSIIYG